MLGSDFRWLWAQSTITNLGDGMLLAAGPLLVTTITREPFAVAMAVFLQQLPWVLFGMPAGAIIDRVDRRRLTILVNALRSIVLLALAATVATGTANLAIVLGSVFLIGTAETFSDNASGALLATHVPKVHLGLANSRLSGTSILGNSLAGPPIGALLFGVGMALPFGVDAACALAGATLVSRISIVARPDPSTVERRHLRHEIADGIRWLWHHPPIRVSLPHDPVLQHHVRGLDGRLRPVRPGTPWPGRPGFGILITAGAVGGLIGSAAYPGLERRFALATLMRFGLVLETVTHLVLAITTSAIVAGAMMTLFGIHAVVWGTTSTTVRQRAVPATLLGRVTSVYMLGAIGGSALGVVIGGLIAQRFGITAPFWFAFFGSAVLLALIWRTLAEIAHAPTAEVGA